MKHLYFANHINSILSDVDSSFIVSHYKKIFPRISTFISKETPIVCIGACNLEKFNIFTAGADAMDSMLTVFDDEVNLFYFECKDTYYFYPNRDTERAIVILRASSEEELLRLFDPKLMILI